VILFYNEKEATTSFFDLGGWLIAIALGLVPLLVNEIVKIFIRARLKRENV
jgi:hypothetical protein